MESFNIMMSSITTNRTEKVGNQRVFPRLTRSKPFAQTSKKRNSGDQQNSGGTPLPRSRPMARCKLNSEVHAILNSSAAFRQVDAGPGSGKTSLLRLLAEIAIKQGTVPSRILVLSHTNATVENFRLRLRKSARDLVAQTCHSLALKLVNDNRAALGLVGVIDIESRFIKTAAVLSDAVALTVSAWVKHCQEHPVDDERRRLFDQWFKSLAERSALAKLLKIFEYHVATGSVMAQTLAYRPFASWIAFAKPLGIIFRRFAALKSKRSVYDFSDLLTMAIKVLTTHSAERTVDRFELLLVDEYQDCTPHQVEFIAALARHIGNVVVVGDRDQVLYEFSGARWVPLAKALPDLQTANFPLLMSHRLHASNAAFADAIRANARSVRFPIRTARDGPKPKLCICKSGTAQVRKIVQLVQDLMARGTPACEIMILARLKMQLHPIEQALRAAGIETDRLGTARNYKLALKVLAMVKLVKHLGHSRIAAYTDGLQDLFPEFVHDEEKWKTEASRLRKARLSNELGSRYVLAAAVYLRLLGKRATTKVERFDLNRWNALCTKFKTVKQMAREVERLGRSAPVVSATVHGAKGGQARHVILAGATEGRIPLRLDRHRPVSLKQERRTMYVAVTRAIDQLHLFHSPFGHPLKGELSRFLDNAVKRDLMEMVPT